MGYNDCRHGSEMCDECLDIMSDGIRQGAEEERDRIIALLETEAQSIVEQFADYIEADFVHALIALIKGENK